jgi:hypothetical protein
VFFGFWPTFLRLLRRFNPLFKVFERVRIAIWLQDVLQISSWAFDRVSRAMSQPTTCRM